MICAPTASGVIRCYGRTKIPTKYYYQAAMPRGMLRRFRRITLRIICGNTPHEEKPVEQHESCTWTNLYMRSVFALKSRRRRVRLDVARCSFTNRDVNEWNIWVRKLFNLIHYLVSKENQIAIFCFFSLNSSIKCHFWLSHNAHDLMVQCK